MVHPARSKIKMRIDSLRVRIWFGWLQLVSGLTSAYALEKCLVPEGYARGRDGALSHRNRMSRYAQGRHVPRPALVERAEVLFPGGRAFLEHPLWQILDPEKNVVSQAAGWISALDLDVQRLLRNARPKSAGQVGTRVRVTFTLLERLVRIGSLDALAAIALLLREASIDNNASTMFQCAQSAWRVLLLAGSAWPLFAVLPELAKVSAAALLDQVTYRGEKVAIGDAPIMIYDDILRSHCLRLEDAGKLRPDHASWVRERLRLFHGELGIDMLFALTMPTVATPELEVDAAAYLRFLHRKILRLQAIRYCCDVRLSNRRFEEDVLLNDPEGRWPALEAT